MNSDNSRSFSCFFTLVWISDETCEDGDEKSNCSMDLKVIITLTLYSKKEIRSDAWTKNVCKAYCKSNLEIFLTREGSSALKNQCASQAQLMRTLCAHSAHYPDQTEISSEEEEQSLQIHDCRNSTRKSCANHAHLPRESRTRTLYINKTKQDKTKHKNILSPKGETKVFLSEEPAEEM